MSYSKDEFVRLLTWFDKPFHVGTVCHREFKNKSYWPAQDMLSNAKHQGLILEHGDSPQIVNSPGVYKCELMLTDDGREFCNLPRLNIEPTKKSKPQKELF